MPEHVHLLVWTLLPGRLFQAKLFKEALKDAQKLLVKKASKRGLKMVAGSFVRKASGFLTPVFAFVAYCTSSEKSYGQCVAEEMAGVTEEEIRQFNEQAEACGRLMMMDSSAADACNNFMSEGLCNKPLDGQGKMPADDPSYDPDRDEEKE